MSAEQRLPFLLALTQSSLRLPLGREAASEHDGQRLRVVGQVKWAVSSRRSGTWLSSTRFGVPGKALSDFSADHFQLIIKE
jgi:hypothetical protein